MLRIEKLNKIYQNDRFNQIGCLSSLKTIPKNHAPRLILFFLFQDTNFLKLFRAMYESLFTKEEKKRKGEEQDYRDSQTWFLGEGWTSRHVKRWVWSKGSFSFYPVLSGWRSPNLRKRNLRSLARKTSQRNNKINGSVPPYLADLKVVVKFWKLGMETVFRTVIQNRGNWSERCIFYYSDN